MALKGSPELRARLKAIKLTFKPVGKAWATDTVHIAQSRVTVRTGATRRSIRVRNASQKRATVVGSHVAQFIDKGTKAHDEKARKARVMRFQANGTIFAKAVHKPAQPARPFILQSAEEALRKNPMAAELIKQWNSAA